MTESQTADAAVTDTKEFFGHPRGLVICFLTEMWERFSYYGMRGLLLLYLVQHFLFTDGEANLIYGGYIALVYIMSMVGGVLSDKYLGQRKAVTFGAILLVAGHFGMAFEGSGSKETLSFNGGDYLIEDVGRDDRRQLFLDYEGETRRIVFESTQFGELGSQRISPINDKGEGDYIVERQTRGLIQNICNVVGLGCAGPEPKTTLILNGERLNVTHESVNAEDEAVLTLADGQSVTELSLIHI